MRDELAESLHEARNELESLEQAVIVMPKIMEEKCCQRLSQVVLANHQLSREAQELRLQMSAAKNVTPGRGRGWMPLGNDFDRPGKGFLMAALVIVALLASASFGWQSRRVTMPAELPFRSVPEIASKAHLNRTITLRASAPSWVEVQELASGKTVLVDVIQPGNYKIVSVGSGLRLRSGRPELLSLQFDDREPEPFGQHHGLGWRVIGSGVLKGER